MTTTIEAIVLATAEKLDAEETPLNQEDYTSLGAALQYRAEMDRVFLVRLVETLQARVMASRYKSLFSC